EQSAVRLADDRVLVAGGLGPVDMLVTASLYDLGLGGNWSSAGRVVVRRHSATTTLLANGRVLLVGGRDFEGNATGAAELYLPDQAPPGTPSATPSITPTATASA